MNKNDKKTKIVIDDIKEFNAFKDVMTAESFFNKFKLSDRLTQELLAAKAVIYSRSTELQVSEFDILIPMDEDKMRELLGNHG